MRGEITREYAIWCQYNVTDAYPDETTSLFAQKKTEYLRYQV